MSTTVPIVRIPCGPCGHIRRGAARFRQRRSAEWNRSGKTCRSAFLISVFISGFYRLTNRIGPQNEFERVMSRDDAFQCEVDALNRRSPD
ncbi:hypothetical protein DF046_28680 [Burkholderia cepacia]|nr:hypothetical protein DF046_28680 [Burkholderia cepacia]